MLCGSMFGLAAGGFHLERHRLFEANFPLRAPRPCKHMKPVVSIIGGHFRDRRRPTGTNHRPNSNIPAAVGHAAIGIDWMQTAEISDAIPPAYAKFIGEQWLGQTVVTRESAPATALEIGLEPETEPELELEPAPGPAAAPALEPSTVLQVDGVEVVYCQTHAEAAALIREMVADAAPRPVAIDIETTAILPERQRLMALSAMRAASHVETLAAGKALRAAQKAAARGEPPDDVAALEDALKALARKERHLAAQVEHAEQAGLDPHRSHIRLVQLYGGQSRAAIVDVFKAGQSVLFLLKGVDAVIHNASFELA